MEVGRPFGKQAGPYLSKKALLIEELKAQLIDLKEQLKTALAEAEDNRRQYEGMFVAYQELADRYDQLLTGGPPLRESQCRNEKTMGGPPPEESNSIPNMESTRRLPSASGVVKKRVK